VTKIPALKDELLKGKIIHEVKSNFDWVKKDLSLLNEISIDLGRLMGIRWKLTVWS